MTYEQVAETSDGPQTCSTCGAKAIYRQLEIDYDSTGLPTGAETVVYHCSNHKPSPMVTNRGDCFGICSPEHCDWPACKDWGFARRAGKLFAQTIGVEPPAGADWLPEPDRGNPA